MVKMFQFTKWIHEMNGENGRASFERSITVPFAIGAAADAEKLEMIFLTSLFIFLRHLLIAEGTQVLILHSNSPKYLTKLCRQMILFLDVQIFLSSVCVKPFKIENESTRSACSHFHFTFFLYRVVIQSKNFFSMEKCWRREKSCKFFVRSFSLVFLLCQNAKLLLLVVECD